MIATLDEITAVLADELDELHLRDEKPPKIGSLHALQSRVGKRASCRVRILDTWPHRDGGHMVRIAVAPYEVPPRLLRPKGGYASDARGAMKDSTTQPPRTGVATGVPHPFLGTPSEPEAVDAVTASRFADESRMASAQANAARRLEHERLPILERLESQIMEAERLGLDASRDMARLESGLAKLERRIRLAKQQKRAA